MSSLNRAFTFAKVNDSIKVIPQHLELDVARMFEIFLEIDFGIPKRAIGFASGCLIGTAKLGFVVADPHPASPTAGGGLQNDGESDLSRDVERLIHRMERAITSRKNRHTALLRHLPGLGLIAHESDRFGGRTNECETTFTQDLGKMGILSEKSVSGMDRIGAGDFGGSNDARYVQVTQAGGCGPDAD